MEGGVWCANEAHGGGLALMRRTAGGGRMGGGRFGTNEAHGGRGALALTRRAPSPTDTNQGVWVLQ